MTLYDDHGQPVNRAFYAKRIADRGVDELLGLCKGVICDGKVQQSEAEYILSWLEKNKEAARKWPCSMIAARCCEYLQDGHLDQDEADDLLDLFSQLTGENPDFCASVNLSTSLPFTRPIPEIVFPRCTFCLTGRFALGPRKECEKEIKSLGGVLSKNVTMKTEYVVIGSIGSEAWIHSNYGRKIEKAVEYREKGHNVAIVPEDLWVQAMTG